MNPLTLFKCLSDDTRLKTVLLIHTHQEVCVCDLQEALEVSQPKVSRHLAELRKCELLADERRGKWVYYKLNPSLPEWAISIIKTAAAKNQDYFHQALTVLNCCKNDNSCCD